MELIYKKILKPIFFLFDPEFVHNQMTYWGATLNKYPPFSVVLKFLYDYRGKDISKKVDGITYRTPILLSAGFDYNIKLYDVLPNIGLGGEEGGSITARKCEGNKKPRLTRLPKNQSIQVYKGLRNDGVDAVIKRLKKRKPNKNFVLGISIARTNDERNSTIEDGIEDYYYTLSRLVEENIGDYYTINISCPNAFCGETFSDNPKLLERLLRKLAQVETNKPIYVKMPINLPWSDFEKLVKLIVRFKLQGVVIGNLNKNYEDLEYREEATKEYRGGLSGKPTAKLSNELIKKTKQKFGKQLTIIGVGGIFTPEDAMEKFQNGADLVQLITGLIYTGPQLVKKIANAYAKEPAK